MASQASFKTLSLLCIGFAAVLAAPCEGAARPMKDVQLSRRQLSQINVDPTVNPTVDPTVTVDPSINYARGGDGGDGGKAINYGTVTGGDGGPVIGSKGSSSKDSSSGGSTTGNGGNATGAQGGSGGKGGDATINNGK